MNNELTIVPVFFKEACDFVSKHHRHHKKPQGHIFSLGLSDGNTLRGVVIVGRPVSASIKDGVTVEVTRLCTDGVKNGCSKLYSAAWRVAKEMGYKKIITYILETEKGTSLIAAGWVFAHKTKGDNWNREGRFRKDDHPLQPKLRFEKV
jgi:hypothetical protein